MIQLTKTILNRPVAAVVCIAALILFGLSSVFGFDLELRPEVNMPVISVIAIYPNAGPEDVEQLVTDPIEDYVNTLSGLDSVTSSSSESQAMIMLSFEYGTDMDEMYIDVQKKIDQVRVTLPDEVEDIMLLTMDSNSEENMRLSLTSEGEGDLLDFAKDTVEKELQKIKEVASIDISGGSSRYISVSLVPEYMVQYGLTMADVASAIQAVNFTIPGGSAEHGSQNVEVSTSIEYETVELLRRTPVNLPGGQSVRLEDISHTDYDWTEPESLSRYNGSDNVSLAIMKNQSSSAVTLSREVNKTVERLRQLYPDIQFTITYDSSETIMESIGSVTETLGMGILLSMVILFLFFGDVKGSLIVGCSMPVSLLVTLILMKFMGFSLNMMTMGSLVIGIGMMVDNSVVVVEMCFRKRDEGMHFMEAAYEGTKVVLLSIIASTITTVVVYMPLSFLEGMAGQMFGQIGYTIVFSITASLFSAITIVPLCFSRFCPIEKKESRVNRVLAKVSNFYGAVLRKILNRKKSVAIAGILIFVSAVCIVPFLRVELVPNTDEGQVLVDVTFRSGRKLEFMDETIREMEEYLLKQPETESVSVSVSETTSDASLTAALKDGADTNQTVDKWGRELQDYRKNCEITVSSVSSMNMSDGSMSNGNEFVFVGDNLDDLKRISEQVADIAGTVGDVLSIDEELADTKVRAKIVVDPWKSNAAGLSTQAIAGEVYRALKGFDVDSFSVDGQDYTVTLEYPKEMYVYPEDLMQLSFMNSQGNRIPLSEVADIVYTDTPQTIRRKDGQYTASVTVTMAEEDKERIVEEIQTQIDRLAFPDTVSQGINMEEEMMAEEFTALGYAIATAVFLVFMVMAIQFESIRYSLLVMFCIPFSLTGSFFLLLVTQCKVSMVSLLGFLMLAGIVVNNGIILVDTIDQNRKAMKLEDALVNAGQSRLRPILMTTLTTILAMLPLAMGYGSNVDMMQGMAVVIVGGLTASTLLALLLLPTFYLIVCRK